MYYPVDECIRPNKILSNNNQYSLTKSISKILETGYLHLGENKIFRVRLTKVDWCEEASIHIITYTDFSYKNFSKIYHYQDEIERRLKNGIIGDVYKTAYFRIFIKERLGPGEQNKYIVGFEGRNKEPIFLAFETFKNMMNGDLGERIYDDYF